MLLLAFEIYILANNHLKSDIFSNFEALALELCLHFLDDMRLESLKISEIL